MHCALYILHLSTRPVLLLLGHFPPPRGGVATHLDRLRAALRRTNITARFLSFGDANPAERDTLVFKEHPVLFLRALSCGASVLHYHTDEADWKSAVLLSLWCLARRQKYLFTLHSFRDHEFLKSGWSRGMAAFVYRHAAKIICISENLRREVQQLLPMPEGKLIVIPSFLPVTEQEHGAEPPPEFMALAQRCSHIISFNAFALTMYNGVDLYGGDILLDAFAEVKDEFPDAGLMMVYLNFGESALANTIRAKARALGDRVVIVEHSDRPFIPMLIRSSVFVRATANDGGPSLSVLEALSLGIFCAASDAVPRPAECALFKNRDAKDLAKVLRELLRRVQSGEKQNAVEFPDTGEELVKLYRSI